MDRFIGRTDQGGSQPGVTERIAPGERWVTNCHEGSNKSIHCVEKRVFGRMAGTMTWTWGGSLHLRTDAARSQV